MRPRLQPAGRGPGAPDREAHQEATDPWAGAGRGRRAGDRRNDLQQYQHDVHDLREAGSHERRHPAGPHPAPEPDPGAGDRGLGGSAQSKSGLFRRSFFTLGPRWLPSCRRPLAALPGLVGRRGFGTWVAARIISISRSRASARLRSWLRKRWASITSTPSPVMRLPAIRISRALTSGGRLGEPATSKRSSTAVDTLLTFWPPGPEARTKRSSSSVSSNAMARVIRIIGSV